MTPDQVQQIVERALRDWHNFPWQAWFLTLVILGIVAFIGFYVAESAKQRAILDALEKNTKVVEGIRSMYAAELEDRRGKNQLRLAALDRRLEAHQQAYGLWRKVIRTVHHEDAAQTVFECQEWWDKNCLYLSEEARDAFQRSYSAAFHHTSYTRANPRDAAALKLINDNWETIQRAGEVIVKAAALPPIPMENEQIENPAENTGQKSATSA